MSADTLAWYAAELAKLQMHLQAGHEALTINQGKLNASEDVRMELQNEIKWLKEEQQYNRAELSRVRERNQQLEEKVTSMGQLVQQLQHKLHSYKAQIKSLERHIRARVTRALVKEKTLMHRNENAL